MLSESGGLGGTTSTLPITTRLPTVNVTAACPMLRALASVPYGSNSITRGSMERGRAWAVTSFSKKNQRWSSMR